MSEPHITPNADRLARAVPKFTCPRCQESGSRVYKSKPIYDGDEDAVRRIHVCLWCGYRFRTLEKLE